MVIYEKVSSFLSRDIVQRFVYGFALIIWIVICINSPAFRMVTLLFDSVCLLRKPYFFYLSYFFIVRDLYVDQLGMLLITILLVIQIIHNHLEIWYLLLGFSIAYDLYSLTSLVIKITSGQYYFKITTYWDYKIILLFLIVILIFFFFNWFIFKLRPVKKNCFNKQ